MVVHAPKVRFETLDDILHQLGDIPPQRVRFDPVPGTATEKDLLRIVKKVHKCFELVNGTVVEKGMGDRESSLALWIGHLLHSYLEGNNLGELLGADGILRLMPGLLRAPDVSFVIWERIEASNFDTVAFADLAIEVLSPSNTKAEMEKKLGEYLTHGVRLVWIVDPKKKQVAVYTSAENPVILTEKEMLDGGEVLPGFAVSVKRIFARRRPPSAKGKPKKDKK